MARKLDPVIEDILAKHGHGQEACWDCHGTWVVYHRVLEQIAAKAGIAFQQPHIIEADGANGVAAVCVTGELDGRIIWSIGEASPKNNKNAYCWAMAEKRAVDRVVLKLIGLHGLAYSEEEADDFKASKPSNQTFGGPLTKTKLKEEMRTFAGDLSACEDTATLAGLMQSNQDMLDQCKRDLPSWYFGDDNVVSGKTIHEPGAVDRIGQKQAELQENEANPSPV